MSDGRFVNRASRQALKASWRRDDVAARRQRGDGDIAAYALAYVAAAAALKRASLLA